MPKFKEQPYQIIIAIDQLFNALTWGWADETFSARCFRLRRRNWLWAFMRRLVDVLFFWDTKEGVKHCQGAFENEQKRVHMPDIYNN